MLTEFTLVWEDRKNRCPVDKGLSIELDNRCGPRAALYELKRHGVVDNPDDVVCVDDSFSHYEFQHTNGLKAFSLIAV